MIKGFETIYGKELEKYKYISTKLYHAIKKIGYSELKVPILEPETSYSENVIGHSPWPEWNKKGCFYISVQDYLNTYEEEPNVQDSLLIPEGTVSVTRWLGEQLDLNNGTNLPIKVFYNMTCFRNEIIKGLNESKKREFTQFGVEILGTSHFLSDIEILYIPYYLLNQIGIESDWVRCRINDIQIFSKLCEESSFSIVERTQIKEMLDELAENKAGKNVDRYTDNIQKIHLYLEKKEIKADVLEKWEYLLKNKLKYIPEEAFRIFGKGYNELFNRINLVTRMFQNKGLNVEVDLCVIRSHEYYTSLSFEIDVIKDSFLFVEVGGGGRYDKLVKQFVHNTKIDRIPSTGFAFGLNRLKDMLEKMNIYPDSENVQIDFNFNLSVNPDLILLENYEDYIDVFKENIEKSGSDGFSFFLGNTLINQKYISVNNRIFPEDKHDLGMYDSEK
ncbi:MAG: ATP phosphoribosyltransferase regulatory subunit [Bacillota bacterium]|nr:ATP phosphoribosyltransferase regulatory subunit [Bacillota bacterium]